MKQAVRSRQEGFSLIELLIVVAIILILVAIAIPGGKRIRINVDEAAVMKELQTVHVAQTQYYSQFGKYAATLLELDSPDGVAEGPAAAHLIPKSLGTGEKNGYLFQMVSTTGGYTVQASPAAFGDTGRRTFYLDADGVIHQNWGKEPATAASPEIR